MTQHLPQFVIAEKPGGAPWPKSGNASRAIEIARLDYENGRIEMATRREDGIEYLYAIPRKRLGTLRPGYFKNQ